MCWRGGGGGFYLFALKTKYQQIDDSVTNMAEVTICSVDKFNRFFLPVKKNLTPSVTDGFSADAQERK